MKMLSIGLTAAALVVSGGMVAAQQQYDSLGSPTPATSQNSSPRVTAPNAPSSDARKADTAKGTPSTTGSGATSNTSGAAGSGSVSSDTGTATPSGLTND